MPWPRGSSPIRSRCSSVRPTVTKSERCVRVGSSTPSAPYVAPTSSTAVSTIRCEHPGQVEVAADLDHRAQQLPELLRTGLTKALHRWRL